MRGFIPPPATGLTATAGDSQARLCWNATPGATGYVITYRDISAGTQWVRLPYPATGTCNTVKLLVNGHSYQFRIRASNGNGEADYSNTATTTLPAAIPPPATGLTATPGDAQARLCWNAAPGATGYVVYYRDTTAGTAWVRLPYPAEGTCTTVKLLVNGHTEEFRIRASNGNGEADYSNTATTTLPAIVPAPATGLTATPGDAQVHLCWNATPAATGYVIYYRDVTAATQWVRLPYPAEGTCTTVKLLVNGHTEEFRIRASNGNGEADYSNTATAVPGS
ncbi:MULTISPECIES: fibronectin type III domain-containing protein [unclassified Frankia]|uniref:fibronectin type III domain-containing protein n=1 Tax=unclassified Frankia TaxID=2632575 RepID=UPI0006F65729|nr:MULTISPECIES: fibronectin type III domain-containing protein [unclassified Frankia]